MVVRVSGGAAEAEPVEVDTDAAGETTLTLDDGSQLVFDATELQASVGFPPAVVRRAA